VAGGGGDGATGGGGIGVWPPCEACEVGEEATRLPLSAASLRHEPYRPNGPDLVVWPHFEIGLKISGPWQTGNVTKSTLDPLQERERESALWAHLNFSMIFSVEF